MQLWDAEKYGSAERLTGSLHIEDATQSKLRKLGHFGEQIADRREAQVHSNCSFARTLVSWRSIAGGTVQKQSAKTDLSVTLAVSQNKIHFGAEFSLS